MDEAASTLPRKTRVLCVMDQEADVLVLFAAYACAGSGVVPP